MIDIDEMERIVKAGDRYGHNTPGVTLELIAEVRALRDRDIKLFYELEGVVIDTERGHGFDEVCLNTVKRVRDALGGVK